MSVNINTPQCSIVELRNYIRFQLGQLNARNQHHHFEDLCREFARLRICENILPATGPVSAGGDQGRDFETYKTYLSTTPIKDSSFLACKSTKPIVFACSLNKKFETKIKGDLATIFKDNPDLEHVFYFSNQDIHVGKRHELEKFSQDNYQTNLTIFDGQALSEILSDIDVFWIAQQYLGVPSSIYPKLEKSLDTYNKYKKIWLHSSLSPRTYADFSQIQFGLREARYNRNERPDLVDWIKKMESFLSDQFSNDIKRKAIYEIAVAAYRGQNNLAPQIERIKQYFSKIEGLRDVDELVDAICLLSDCSTAPLDHCKLDEALLNAWHAALIFQTEKLLKENARLGTPAYRAYLLMLRGQLETICPWQSNRDNILKNTLKWWNRVISEAKRAPLFPLVRFSRLLNILIPLLERPEAFIELAKKTDALIGSRSSMNTIAENCRDRAIAFYKAKNYIQAIRQLQESKINWFTAETLRGSLFAMLTIADCYRELKLIHAAKYYAATTANIAFHSNDVNVKDILPMALFFLSECCFEGGEWLFFMSSTRLVLMAHNNYDENPLDLSQHENLVKTLSNFLIIRTLSKRFLPKLSELLETQYLAWPIDTELREGIDQLAKEDRNSLWLTETKEALWDKMQNELSGRPFCELGKTRKITWNALGIKWCIHFENTYEISALAENLAAIIQIVLADIADIDLCLLPTSVDIKFDLNDRDKIDFEYKPDNFSTSLKISLPMNYAKNTTQTDEVIQKIESEIFALSLSIINQCSMLPNDKIKTTLSKKMKEGLTNYAFTGMPYWEAYQEVIISKNQFEEFNVSTYESLNDNLDFNVLEAYELRWNDSPGFGYSKSTANKFLKNRYTITIKPIRLTLKNALENSQFNKFLHQLKNEGYLDWQILLIIFNTVINYRAHQKGFNNLQEQMTFQKELMNREESESDVKMPITELLEQLNLQKKLGFGMILVTIAKTWRLEIKQPTPDMPAIKKLLDIKYANSSDDISHKDFFGIELSESLLETPQ